ncbi:MAG: diguanylate cyclase [Acetobacteraceae bacterium]
MAALDAYQILDTDYDEAFDRYTRVAATLVGTPIAAISFVDADRQWFKSVYGMTLRQTAREHAFCAHTILGSLPLVVEDALQDPRFANNPLVIGEPWVRFYAGAPLLTPAGLSVGSLCTIDTRPRSISLEQSRGLADLADAIVTTLELYKTMREMKQLALTDALTGLANRVQFFRFLKASIAPLLRHGRPLSLLYLDCDNFKQLNDVSGHDEGGRYATGFGRHLAPRRAQHGPPGAPRRRRVRRDPAGHRRAHGDDGCPADPATHAGADDPASLAHDDVRRAGDVPDAAQHGGRGPRRGRPGHVLRQDQRQGSRPRGGDQRPGDAAGDRAERPQCERVRSRR